MNDKMDMYQSWMAVAGPHLSCKYIHPGTSCIYEFFVKILLVAKKSYKFYAILHLLSFCLKFKKSKQNKKELIKKTIKNYVGSVFFMMALVGGLKASLCVNNNLRGQNNGKFLIKAAIPSSLCIFFEDQFRRREISYFVLVRALRSVYVMLKRRKIFMIACEEHLSFVLIFGILSYIYSEKGHLLKEKGLIDNIWGDS